MGASSKLERLKADYFPLGAPSIEVAEMVLQGEQQAMARRLHQLRVEEDAAGIDMALMHSPTPGRRLLLFHHAHFHLAIVVVDVVAAVQANASDAARIVACFATVPTFHLHALLQTTAPAAAS